VRPLGGRVANPRWKAYACNDFMIWLSDCHRDPQVLMRTVNHLGKGVDRLETAGPLAASGAGNKWVDKLTGNRYRGLGKVNYDDDVGAFRFFFKFGVLGAQPVVIFGDGDYKTDDDFRPERYERALRQVEQCMEHNGVRDVKAW
jgi:hypothetical protein